MRRKYVGLIGDSYALRMPALLSEHMYFTVDMGDYLQCEKSPLHTNIIECKCRKSDLHISSSHIPYFQDASARKYGSRSVCNWYSRNACILHVQQYSEIVKISKNNSNVAIQDTNNWRKRWGELGQKWWSNEGMNVKLSRS